MQQRALKWLLWQNVYKNPYILYRSERFVTKLFGNAEIYFYLCILNTGSVVFPVLRCYCLFPLVALLNGSHILYPHVPHGTTPPLCPYHPYPLFLTFGVWQQFFLYGDSKKKIQEGGGCFSRHSPVEKKSGKNFLLFSTEVSSFSNKCDIYI